MTKEEIQTGLKNHGPFSYVIDLPYGLKTPIHKKSKPNDLYHIRINSFVDYAFPSILKACNGFENKTILDIGCNCGGFSFEAAKNNAKIVIGIDINDKFIKQALFLCKIFKEEHKWDTYKVFFCTGNPEESLDKNLLINTNITFCFGLLYHFANPVRAMQNIASVTKDVLVVDTTVHKQKINRSNWIMKTLPQVPWSKKKVIEMVPNEQAVVELLKFVGFKNLTKIKPKKNMKDGRYLLGNRVTYICKR